MGVAAPWNWLMLAVSSARSRRQEGVFSCDPLASDPVSIGGLGAFVLKESSRHTPQHP